MGRKSTKANKNIYQLRREELELSREKASELLECITPEKLEKIENEKVFPDPSDVLAMSEGYKMPSLCNYFCSNECPIGSKYVPQIKMKGLAQTILEMLASLNAMQKKQERLIEITANGKIEEDEIADLVQIQKELEDISMSVEALQLLIEQMIVDEQIDKDDYNSCKNRINDESF